MTEEKTKNGKVEITKFLLIQLSNAVADGAETHAEIGAAIGISPSTLGDWLYGKRGKKIAEQVREAIEDGKGRRREVFAQLAENALKKLLNGYEADEVTDEEIEDAVKGLTRKRKVVKKKYKPDTVAVIFAAVNAGKGKWRSINHEREPEINLTENELAIPGFDPDSVVTSGQDNGKAEEYA